MKQFHSWAKIKLKNHASIVLDAPTDVLFLLLWQFGGWLFVDEADPTLPPPPPPVGPGLAKTRSGAMSAPVEVGFPVVKMFFFGGGEMMIEVWSYGFWN